MRILGLDVGEKTVGVAISDPLGLTAQGVKTIRRTGCREEDVRSIEELCQQYEVDEIVVGLPKHMNNTKGLSAERSEAFAEALRTGLGITVVTRDERLSSWAAEQALIQADVSRAGRKRVIDKVAAQIILQGYLDSRRTSS